jgi:hypothetical protein
MRIEHSSIGMQSSHELQIRHQEISIRRETRFRPAAASSGRQSGAQGDSTMRVSLSTSAAIQNVQRSNETYSASSAAKERDLSDSDSRAKLQVLLKTLEKLTGKSYHVSEIRFTPPDDDAMAAVPEAGATSQASGGSASGQVAPPTLRQIETLTAYRHEELEKTRFSAAGTLHTQDGQELQIHVALSMDRKFYEKNVTYTKETGPLTDPLVIGFGGNAADLTEKTYSFDLNSDGMDEKIPFAAPGTGGFLAYDRNQDGVVNDGGELFGPASGDGFSELASYDQDGNGWIDAGDAIYYDLSVWTKTADGRDSLVALADTGIGAIYLNAAETPFTVTTAANETLGQVRRTGIYVNENGSAGILQQVDLSSSVQPDPAPDAVKALA